MPKNLVIVESPAKAHTIEKYLGKDFHVLASVGHIRKDVSVDKTTFDVEYEIDEGHKKIISELKKAAKAADKIWLATDEDREGESISWHLLEVLKLPKSTSRITFHEITKPALEAAIAHPRTVDMDMVASQQARQTLDMLVGFDLSSVVRKKVPGAISAGRVQSPALRLVVEKEREIEKFNKKSSFKITGKFGDPEFPAILEKLIPNSKPEAENILNLLKNAKFRVENVEKTEGTRSNPVPFSTASLQIEANARLGFSSKTTMRAAQALYQAGQITYHRTDSLNLSEQAIAAMAAYIEQTFGKEYLHVRHFKTKSAGAQEAHEAIRPTNINVAEAGKNDFEKKLYHLIRSRTLATQMSPAKVAKTALTLRPEKPGTTFPSPIFFTAKGEIVIFDGFLKVYGKFNDSELPSLKKGDLVDYNEITARETFAKPPARYTEGSLVKKLEELGIGRPSTYASIMEAIQSRNYVQKGESEGEPREIDQLTLKGSEIISEKTTEKSGATKGKLIPTPIGELVADFLTDNFNQVVDYGFTAGVEEKLDLIADKKLERVKMLRDFYTPFSALIGESGSLMRYNNATSLGTDPKTGKPIYAKIGKNGGFIQLGDAEKESGEKPRFVPLPKGKTVKTVTLEDAIAQLSLPSLPRNLGSIQHNKETIELVANSGPFGPYLKAGKYNIPLGNEDPYRISLETAKELFAKKIDSIIADWGDIMILVGAYGPYIKGPGRFNNVKIPKETDPKSITKSQAEEMLKNKPKSSSFRRFPRKSAKKS
ncbi:type I DNA topoisomerase [Candidatus Saccharibacteria bacterium]|nr:type I DNA topoisomerase [Candidatus Saccharibacteria bacterium]